MGEAADLYGQDFIAWTEQQARVLREAAAGRTNLALDWEHLIEEVEDLGRSQYDAVESQIARIVEHLFKLECSPARDPQRGWKATIRSARGEIERKLEHDPGLRPRLAAMLRDVTPLAAKLAAGALADYDEDMAGIAARLHAAGGYPLEHVIGDWWPAAGGQE